MSQDIYRTVHQVNIKQINRFISIASSAQRDEIRIPCIPGQQIKNPTKNPCRPTYPGVVPLFIFLRILFIALRNDFLSIGSLSTAFYADGRKSLSGMDCQTRHHQIIFTGFIYVFQTRRARAILFGEDRNVAVRTFLKHGYLPPLEIYLKLSALRAPHSNLTEKSFPRNSSPKSVEFRRPICLYG